MKKLGIDGRTPEQRFLDEIREEELRQQNGGMMEVQLADGSRGPQMSILVNKTKDQAPKQDLSKPEKSI